MCNNQVWIVKLDPYHYEFFSKLAIAQGDTERGKEARQVRKFLNDKIIEHKRQEAVTK